ncbi:MAG: hypothetical protein ACRDN0_18850, partial [Trebonia sp.]
IYLPVFGSWLRIRMHIQLLGRALRAKAPRHRRQTALDDEPDAGRSMLRRSQIPGLTARAASGK